MHANNHPLFHYCRSSFINPKLLEDQSISFEKLLEDEAVAMAFPLDGKYFDDFPTIQKDMHSDVASHQYPRPELTDNLLVFAKLNMVKHTLIVGGIPSPPSVGVLKMVSQVSYSI